MATVIDYSTVNLLCNKLQMKYLVEYSTVLEFIVHEVIMHFYVDVCDMLFDSTRVLRQSPRNI